LPTLIAVSKTKEAPLLKQAYEAKQRDFGENYVQELLDKAPNLPDDIRWHFIGHLQSSKCKTLLKGVKNLYMVQSVDSQKLANKLNEATKANRSGKLKVLVQVNTSGESSKFGCEPKECIPLVEHIIKSCDALEFSGLMTIGRMSSKPEPECFQSLLDCRTSLVKELKLEKNAIELSMGMSSDLELAIDMESTMVRVGTTIFGTRPTIDK